jgi:hypothetical protein
MLCGRKIETAMTCLYRYQTQELASFQHTVAPFVGFLRVSFRLGTFVLPFIVALFSGIYGVGTTSVFLALLSAVSEPAGFICTFSSSFSVLDFAALEGGFLIGVSDGVFTTSFSRWPAGIPDRVTSNGGTSFGVVLPGLIRDAVSSIFLSASSTSKSALRTVSRSLSFSSASALVMLRYGLWMILPWWSILTAGSMIWRPAIP